MRYQIFKGPYHDWIAKPECTPPHRVGHHFGRPEQCTSFYLNYNECLEAYGFKRGMKACEDFRNDFHECRTMDRAIYRAARVKAERVRQILEGERKLSDYYGHQPERDSYVQQAFF